jgi:hypothetical protein
MNGKEWTQWRKMKGIQSDSQEAVGSGNVRLILGVSFRDLLVVHTNEAGGLSGLVRTSKAVIVFALPVLITTS